VLAQHLVLRSGTLLRELLDTSLELRAQARSRLAADREPGWLPTRVKGPARQFGARRRGAREQFRNHERTRGHLPSAWCCGNGNVRAAASGGRNARRASTAVRSLPQAQRSRRVCLGHHAQADEYRLPWFDESRQPFGGCLPATIRAMGCASNGFPRAGKSRRFSRDDVLDPLVPVHSAIRCFVLGPSIRSIDRAFGAIVRTKVTVHGASAVTCELILLDKELTTGAPMMM
jgi:hypothetical protein